MSPTWKSWKNENALLGRPIQSLTPAIQALAATDLLERLCLQQTQVERNDGLASALDKFSNFNYCQIDYKGPAELTKSAMASIKSSDVNCFDDRHLLILERKNMWKCNFWNAYLEKVTIGQCWTISEQKQRLLPHLSLLLVQKSYYCPMLFDVNSVIFI